MGTDYPELKSVKRFCLFIVPDPLLPKTGPNYDTYIAIHILDRIASGLASAGHPVSKVKPGFGIDAACHCLLNRFLDIDVLLWIWERHDQRIHCMLEARPFRPMLSLFFLSQRPTESDCAEQLQEFLRAIDEEIVNHLEGTSTSWMNRDGHNLLVQASDAANPNSNRGEQPR
jgi:hypothetical protein